MFVCAAGRVRVGGSQLGGAEQKRDEGVLKAEIWINRLILKPLLPSLAPPIRDRISPLIVDLLRYTERSLRTPKPRNNAVAHADAQHADADTKRAHPLHTTLHETTMMMKTASTPRVGGLRSSKQFSEGRLRTFRATRASVDGSNNAADAASADKAVTRRALVGLVAGASALAGRAAPSLAAYGEAANVFGGFTGDKSGFTKYEGDGYSVLIPAKWNPSKEKDFPGTDLR